MRSTFMKNLAITAVTLGAAMVVAGRISEIGQRIEQFVVDKKFEDIVEHYIS